MSATHESCPFSISTASRGPHRLRERAALAVVGCAALFCCSIEMRADARSPENVLDRFLAKSAQRVPVAYRAMRRLEASTDKLKAAGWVEALTEFDPHTGLRVQILAEGGTGRIRSALKGILDAERQATQPGRSRDVALTVDNYTFQPGAIQADGLVALYVTPRRRDVALVDGTIFVTAADADLVRVEGRLAKSPSFWTRSVDVVRHYGHRAGRMVPVEIRSVADVKVAGPTQFVMSYQYESVNGQAAGELSPPLLLARYTGTK